MNEPSYSDGTEPTPDYSLPDPATLADRDEVDYVERTFVHGDEDHCEAGLEGRAVVGATDDAGELLLRIHRESGVGILPNAKVGADDDWAAKAVEAVQKQTGVDVEIDAVERVRRADHCVEGAETPFETTTHVVFRASPVSDDDPHTDADGVTVGWHDDVPDGNGDRPADDDPRLFVD